jgi:hypothetical protein
MSIQDERKEPLDFTTVQPVVSADRNEVHITSDAGERRPLRGRPRRLTPRPLPADEAALIASKFVGMELDPVEADRVRRKIDLWVWWCCQGRPAR